MGSNIPRLVSVKTLAEIAPETFPEPRTRDLIYHAEERVSARGEVIPPNGFGACFIRVKRHVLIDLDAAALWLESHRVAPLAALDELKAAP